MNTIPPKSQLNLDVEFQNFGKINKADIKLRPFTVIAGPNGSGKSFVTRALYSVFRSVEGINAQGHLGKLIDDLSDELNSMLNTYPIEKINELKLGSGNLNDIEVFHDSFQRLTNQIKNDLSNGNILNSTPLLLSVLEKEIKALNKLFDQKYPEESTPSVDSVGIQKIVNSFIIGSLRQLYSTISDIGRFISNPQNEVTQLISKQFRRTLLNSFMASSTENLAKAGSSEARINFKDIGSINLYKATFGINSDFVEKFSPLNFLPPVYLESPIYWKLAPALESSREALSETAKRRRLDEDQLTNQVPQYFFDLMEMLEVQVKTDEFNDIASTIENAIKGNLSFSNGTIQFNDSASNSTVGMNLTALGVANLGMIALLLRRGVILPGTVLFIDEPEVHLHPKWQVIFVQVLYELSKRGVSVVIASHSIDIMKAVEGCMDDEDVEQSTHFGINQLTEEGNSVDDSDNNYKRLASIKSDLGTPFYEMFMDKAEW